MDENLREVDEGLWHESGPHALPCSELPDHELEELMPVRRDQGVGKFPIDFELTTGILMVGLPGISESELHAITKPLQKIRNHR